VHQSGGSPDGEHLGGVDNLDNVKWDCVLDVTYPVSGGDRSSCSEGDGGQVLPGWRPRHGFIPRLELAIALGCELNADRFVRIDDPQVTTAESVYAVGRWPASAESICPSRKARSPGNAPAAGTDGVLRPAVAKRATYTAFADRIERAHGTRAGWPGWLTDETIVCRCE